MLSHPRTSISSFALKTLTGAVASALFLSSSAYAAGLGKLTVLSALGQPLRAEIELTAVSSDEASSLVAKLAPADAFKTANIDFNPALVSLRFAVEQRSGRQIIRISSTQPVNEPFVDMLLELSWNTGRLVREYTFLLDPPDMRSPQPAQVAPMVTAQPARTPAQTPAPAASTPAPAASAPAPVARPQPQRAAASDEARSDARNGATEYKVKSGDTLGGIARQLKPVDISLDTMLAALYQANPDAFNGNNLNRLKSGRILSVPAAETLKSSNEGEAHSLVVAHAADFTSYRNKLAGQVASAAPTKGQEASQNAAGKITAKVEERPSAISGAQDQLKLSRSAGAAKGALSAEDTVAKNRALADATARVKELEKNVSDLEKLVAVRGKTGADKVAADKALAEKAAADKAATAKAAADKVVADKAAAEKARTDKIAADKAAAADKIAADKAAAAEKAAAEKAAKAPKAAPPVEAPVVAPVVAPVASPTEAASVPAPVKPKAPKSVVKPVAPAAEPGIVDMLLDNMTYIAGFLGIAALAIFGLSRRKKNIANPMTEPSIQGTPTDQAPSLFAQTGGQSIDTNNSVFNSSFAPSASQLDTNEVDPVAEADVYIAYGRDAQAEEILKEALRIHPERYPVRLKLLEIYAARKDLRAYETQAGEFYGLTKGEGDEWAQAAAIGLTIDPANPLYAGAVAGAAPLQASGNDYADSDLLNLDLNLADSSETALPVTPVAAAAPTDDQTLDFDLGGLSFEPVTPAATNAAASTLAATPASTADINDMAFFTTPDVPAAPAASADASAFDMAFDMPFDTTAATAPTPAASSLDDISLDLSSDDLSHEFDMDDLAKSLDAPSAAPGLTNATTDNGLEFASMDFDMPAAASTSAPAAPSLADDPFGLDLPHSAEKPNYAAATYAGESYSAAAPAFDMSSIDLDLPGDAHATSDAAAHAVADADTAVHADEGSAGHMEMETKLDLAIAYQEIGDKEGARELLDEVIKGGSSAQVTKATEMRVKLA